MILVTGAAGFIGSNLLADLEAAGLGPIAICDRLGDDDKWRNLAKREISVFVRAGEVRDWLREETGVAAVLHMGAISATTERDYELLVDINIRLTVDLWDICATRRIPFVYASSAATYGALESRLIDDEDLAALARLTPLNAYGWSKAATDRILMRRVADKHLVPPQWAGFKFFNVYGPNEYHKGPMMSVIARLFENVRRGLPVSLFRSERSGIADGEQRRDFIYVKDCTAAILWLIRNPGVSGLFNLGTGNARTFNDVVRALGAALDVEVAISYADMPPELRGGYQYHTQAEMGKLAAHGLDHSRFHTLEDGVKDYVSSHLATLDRYR
jgi:ADP-L-glycero-D-manno-heptose 6-epimerase